MKPLDLILAPRLTMPLEALAHNSPLFKFDAALAFKRAPKHKNETSECPMAQSRNVKVDPVSTRLIGPSWPSKALLIQS